MILAIDLRALAYHFDAGTGSQLRANRKTSDRGRFQALHQILLKSELIHLFTSIAFELQRVYFNSLIGISHVVPQLIFDKLHVFQICYIPGRGNDNITQQAQEPKVFE